MSNLAAHPANLRGGVTMCPRCQPKLLSLQLSLLTEKYTWAEVLDRLSGLAFEDHYEDEIWLRLSQLLDEAAEVALEVEGESNAKR